MEDIGTGAGLAALGFWCFVATMVVVGVWSGIRKRDAQHETLRRVIESGQSIDDELTDKLLSLTGSSKDLDRDLKVSGVILLGIAPGMVVLGWVLSIAVSAELLLIMLGVAGLIGFVGIGLLAGSYVVQRWYREDVGLSRA